MANAATCAPRACDRKGPPALQNNWSSPFAIACQNDERYSVCFSAPRVPIASSLLGDQMLIPIPTRFVGNRTEGQGGCAASFFFLPVLSTYAAGMTPAERTRNFLNHWMATHRGTTTSATTIVSALAPPSVVPDGLRRQTPSTSRRCCRCSAALLRRIGGRTPMSSSTCRAAQTLHLCATVTTLI